jgi:hypothetical protein
VIHRKKVERPIAGLKATASAGVGAPKAMEVSDAGQFY